MLGRLLDQRYQVVQVLGQGGFGHTYIAEDTRRPGNPTCVVKHLKPATTDPDFLQTARRLFNSEAETLEKLGTHDQIPRLLAYFEENEEFFLVQEYIGGHPLSKEMAQGTRWNEKQVIELLAEVLSILEFVHSHGVIHRDIKPDNLIRRTSDNKLVLVDFGAVKQLKMQSLLTNEPANNDTIAIGTPGYMPSEQGQGRPRPSSDIYALGIIGIQALTGFFPTNFAEDPKTGELLWRQYVPHINDYLAGILTKMVRHYFKFRYQSAIEAQTALQPLILPHSAQALAYVVQQKGWYYLKGGYVYTAKALSVLRELTKPAYVPPTGTSAEETQPQSGITVPDPANSVQNTVTIASGSFYTPAPQNYQSPRQKILLVLAGSTIAIAILSMIAAGRQSQSSFKTANNQPVTIAQNNIPPTTAPPSPPPVKVNNPPQSKGTCVITRTTNLRSAPHGNDIGEVKTGTKVTVTGEKDGYIQISEPQPGWIYKRRAVSNSCPHK